MHKCTQYTLFVWTVIQALKCLKHSSESAAQKRLQKKNENILHPNPPEKPSDSTTHEHAIRCRTASEGLRVKCVRACTVLMSEIRWEDETCFEPAVISESLLGLLRFVPVLLKDRRASN